jgi:hypothetical protein
MSTIGGAAQPEDNYIEQVNSIGLLGRVNYNYADKYLTSITFRRDADSRFSPNYRWGNFPSVSVAWRIAREDFWTMDAVNDLKLRASYGSLGNSEFLRAWQYYSSINPFPRAVFGPNEVEQIGGIVTLLSNRDLRWERKNTLNFGVDGGFLNNRLSFVADYCWYIRW